MIEELEQNRIANETHVFDKINCEWIPISDQIIDEDRRIQSGGGKGATGGKYDNSAFDERDFIKIPKAFGAEYEYVVEKNLGKGTYPIPKNDSRSQLEITLNDLNNWIREQLSLIIGHLQNFSIFAYATESVGHFVPDPIKTLPPEPTSYPSPLDQIKNGIEIFDVKCTHEFHYLAFYKDATRSACVTWDTLRTLTERGWAMKSHDDVNGKDTDVPNRYQLFCEDGSDLVQYIYRPSISHDFQPIEYYHDGNQRVAAYDYIPVETCNKCGVHGHVYYANCLVEHVESFYECQDTTHFRDDSNWPIVTCTTLVGQTFEINEEEEMEKAMEEHWKDHILFTFQYEEQLGLPVL